MATNIKFHRITATSGSNINTGTNYTKGDVYFIKSATGNTGKVYICTVAGKGAAATLEDYSVDTNTWRPVVNNLTSTSTDSSLSAAMGKSLSDSITSLNSSLASHTHDGRYYTESEVNNLLANKSNTGHTHTKSQITDFAHNHDDRYYTESEIDTKLGTKSNNNHTHSYIVTQGDTRSVATKPSDYSNRITFAGLKNNSTIGSPSSTTYNYVVGLRGWSDTSGGKAHELAFSDNGIFHRIGATDTWESWDQLETKGNTSGYLNKISKSGNTLTITPKDGTAFTFTNTTYSRKWDDNLSNSDYPGYGDAVADALDTSFSLVNVGDMKRWNKTSYMLEGLETLLASI